MDSQSQADIPNTILPEDSIFGEIEQSADAGILDLYNKIQGITPEKEPVHHEPKHKKREKDVYYVPRWLQPFVDFLATYEDNHPSDKSGLSS